LSIFSRIDLSSNAQKAIPKLGVVGIQFPGLLVFKKVLKKELPRLLIFERHIYTAVLYF